MYKLGFIVLGLVSVILAAPVDQTSPVPIVKQSQDGPNPDGSYSWNYETANGITAQESGTLVQSEKNKDGAMSVQGAYSYLDENGEPIQLTYIADENGFQPQGAHLPTTPAIPAEILRALEYNAAHPEENDYDPSKSQ